MKPTSTQGRGGFTLIELLVVIAIIGILSTLAIVALGSARQKSRDAKRLADLKQVANALELYYSDNNQYPTAITPGQPLSNGTTVYMASVPSNPSPRADGSCPDQNYTYMVDSTNKSYSFTGCIGTSTSPSASTSSSTVSAMPSGTFVCGQNITDNDGHQYTTVQVGTQCWMKENIRTRLNPDGSCINGQVNNVCNIQANNTAFDCISTSSNARDSSVDCTSGYAIYTWAGMMNGATTEGAQGICPTGWHIPTNAETHTLELYLTDSPSNESTCNGARNGTTSCATAGTKLKTGGSSGFEWIRTGGRSSNGSTFVDSGNVAYLWSSTPSGGTAWYREVSTAATDILLRPLSKSFSYPVRCLKN